MEKCNYLIKCMTKGEEVSGKVSKRLIQPIMNANNDNTALRTTMVKLIGNRNYGQQETIHLMSSLPIMICSHKFVRIDFENKLRKVSSANINSTIQYTQLNHYAL